jgi:hypothetical protein
VNGSIDTPLFCFRDIVLLLDWCVSILNPVGDDHQIIAPGQYGMGEVFCTLVNKKPENQWFSGHPPNIASLRIPSTALCKSLVSFFHPDYTVGPGVSPDPARSLAALVGCHHRSGIAVLTAHPAPKANHLVVNRIIVVCD